MKHYIGAIGLLFLLNACGGGGSSSVEEPPTEVVVEESNLTQTEENVTQTDVTTLQEENSSTITEANLSTPIVGEGATLAEPEAVVAVDNVNIEVNETLLEEEQNATTQEENLTQEEEDNSTSEQNTTQEEEEEEVEPTPTTSYIVDAPIEGLSYECNGTSGITDANGTFTCLEAPVTFKVGALTIGTLSAFTSDLLVYPQDLVGVEREAIRDDRVVALARFLQTLDDDGNLSRGITLSSDVAQQFRQEMTFETLSSQEKMNLLIERGYNVRSREDVIEHLRETMALPLSPLSQALVSEDIAGVEEETLLEALHLEAEDKLHYCMGVESFLYPEGLERVDFPSIRSDYFTSTSNENIPLHTSYNEGKYRVYSYIGQKEDFARYAVLGTNIFKFDSEEGYSDILNDLNQELKGSTTQLFKWLLHRSVDAPIFEENLTILVNKEYMQTSLEEWLSDNEIVAPDWNITTDITLLESGNFDIYIAVDEATQQYQEAIEQHKPVIVFQNWIIPNSDMLHYFGMKWRWYGGIEAGDWESIESLCRTLTPEVAIDDTIKHLENETLHFDYTTTACTNYVGTITCHENLLLNDDGSTLFEAFSHGAQSLKDFIKAQDEEGRDIFTLPNGYTFMKMALLLGDSYRQAIHYPMDKESTDDTTFFKAYYADYARAYARSYNALQPDLGDFTNNIEDILAVERSTQRVEMTPTPYSEWSATGLYALPSQTIKVRRLDESDNVIEVRFNMLRDGTTKVWNSNGYSRPDFVASNPVLIEKGRSYTISSPLGGPIYVRWNGVESNASAFTLEFENVATFPALMSLDSDAIADFTEKITTSVFDWIDIKTPYVEIHTLKSKFDGSYTTSGYFPYEGNLTQYLEDINHYTVLNNLNLAGFKGENLSLSSEVTQWCETYGLDCTSDVHTKPSIQHINADIHALCGDGCSGNPFDVDWSITPTGWGESHEYGHNLQRTRLKIYGGRSTEVSNNIFPLHTNWDYLVDHNLSVHPKLTAPSGAKAYEQLQAEIAKQTPASIEHPMWSGDGIYDNVFARLSFYNQIPFIEGSWDIYTKLYIVERLFTQAIKNTTDWENNQTTLGFSSYDLTEAKEITGNDFMAIALSKFTNKDYRAYFDIWGIELSDKAKEQIDTNGFDEVVPLEFYWVKDDKPTQQFPTRTLPLDGAPEVAMKLGGICSDTTTLSRCGMLNVVATFETPQSDSLYFLSQWSENGASSAIDSSEESTLLTTTAIDSQGRESVLYIRAGKSISSSGIDGRLIAMNDTTESDANETSLVLWIDANDNSFEEGERYSVENPLYINVKEGNTTIERLKVTIEPFMVPVTLSYTDTTNKWVRGFSEIEDSSTYFVTLSALQGPTEGIWSNSDSKTPLHIQVADENGTTFDLVLDGQRDAMQTDGESGSYVEMNSGMIYGKENALILTYDAQKNPDLSSHTNYVATELLVINANLWHVGGKVREQMQIDINITTP